MRRFSVFLLVLLGAIIIVAGTVELLRQVQFLTFSLNVFGPVLILVLGLWIIACAVECRRILRVEQ